MITFIVLKGTGNVSSDETIYSKAGQVSSLTCGAATESSVEFRVTASDDDYDWIMTGASSQTNASGINATTNVELWTIYNMAAGNNCAIYRNGDTSDGVTGIAPFTTVVSGVSMAGGAGGEDCNNVSLGCKVSNTQTFSQHWEGYIFEILQMYEIDITVAGGLAQRTAIETFLKNKYNIS